VRHSKSRSADGENGSIRYQASAYHENEMTGRARKQSWMAFPECDGVWYMDRTRTPREISTTDRIDVLTSLEGMDFDECVKRADRHEVDGVLVYVK
jgi:hypothetical protein